MMKIVENLRNMVNYLAEGFIRIFGPTHDEYPETGVQPFEGEVYNSNSSAD